MQAELRHLLCVYVECGNDTTRDVMLAKIADWAKLPFSSPEDKAEVVKWVNEQVPKLNPPKLKRKFHSREWIHDLRDLEGRLTLPD